MAAEWTHQISYSPGLIMVNIGFDKATADNIKKNKEFGISLAADDQNIVSSVAGGSSGKYHKAGETVQKPTEEVREEISKLVEKRRK